MIFQRLHSSSLSSGCFKNLLLVPHSLSSIRSTQTVLSFALVSSSSSLNKKTFARDSMKDRLRHYSSSSQLPSLPVPNLVDSLEVLKSSAGPHALNMEEFTEFVSIVNTFGKITGPKLHSLLVQKASKTQNWLSSDWWVNKAYLEGRDPLMIWSNPGLVCPRVDVPTGKDNVIKYISHMMMGVLDFRSFLKRGENPEPGVTNSCMNQYERAFGTTRIPGQGIDEIKFGSLSKDSDKLTIILSRRGNFFKITLPHKEESRADNFAFLNQVVNSILYSEDDLSLSSLGCLTSLPRDRWADAFKRLDSNSVKSIIESEFVVCLDEVSNESDFDRNWSENMGRQILHGDANNAGNRWFDKTIQLIIVLNDKRGRVLGSGFCYEHTPAEGPPIVRLMEHSMKYLAKESGSRDWPQVDLSKWSPPTAAHTLSQLPLIANESLLKESLEDALAHHSSFTSSLDLRVLEFTDFGKNLIKTFKMSPDSFIQVAICWAYYRLHKKVGGCYESASTRMFSLGRTECIRSVTPGFYELAQNPTTDALKKAIDDHKKTVKNAMTGKGIDRLLLGMNAAAHEVKDNTWTWGSPPFKLDKSDYELLETLYKNELFLRSKYFLLSTSQVATIFPESFMVYGPLVSDGYGCCYNPSPAGITFGLSAFNTKYAKLDTDVSSSNTDNYKSCLKDTLILMRDMLSSSSNGASNSSKL